MTLSSRRQYIYPQSGDTWESIAARELSERPGEDAAQALQSWNLHVFMRPGGADKGAQPILPSDIIFVEPPRS